MTIRWAVAILIIAGVMLAPVLRPAMAQSPGEMVASDGTKTMAVVDGMDDMPCCPSKAPVPADCDKCLLMAICMAKCVTGLSSGSVEPLFTVSGSLVPPQSDFWPDGLGHPPPDHPPRILI